MRASSGQTVILLLAIGVFAIVAYRDLRTRRIPNTLAAAIAALGLLRMTLNGDMTAALYTLVAGTAVFAATFLLFWRGYVGGGDVKLMSAAALLVGYHDVFAFLFVMSVCGALIALAVLAGDRLGLRPIPDPPPAARAPQEPRARLTVPYGIAISLAAIITLVVQSSVSG